MEQISLPSCSVPVLADVDICVAGGSCTGVFAAVTAARRGARVAIVEPQNRFGGAASASQVCYWHSLSNLDNSRRIIEGLTLEVLERLERRDAVSYAPVANPDWYALLNTEELAIDLDELVKETGVLPFLHARAVDVLRDGEGRLNGVVTAGKGGLGAIRAKFLVDATGDGDLCAAAGVEMWRNAELQPPTTCGKFSRWPKIRMPEELGQMIHAAAKRYALPEGVVWGTFTPHSSTFMLAATKIPDSDISEGAALTAAEIEGRRQLRAIQDLIADAGFPRPVLESLPSLIGGRETKHIRSLYRLRTDDLLSGRSFPDVAARGTYRVDVHSQNPPGTRFLYLDGTEYFMSPYLPMEKRRWRAPGLPTPEYYEIPLRSLIPAGFDNLIAAGRMIDAESGAFGAARVMVNLNQTGEAAGETAFRALDAGRTIPEVAAADNGNDSGPQSGRIKCTE